MNFANEKRFWAFCSSFQTCFVFSFFAFFFPVSPVKAPEEALPAEDPEYADDEEEEAEAVEDAEETGVSDVAPVLDEPRQEHLCPASSSFPQ